jgi:hypothetical protein
MIIYLIKPDNTYIEFNNVLSWTNTYVLYKSGKGTCKIYAKDMEYFTDTLSKDEHKEQ